jgi:hypothetical protein
MVLCGDNLIAQTEDNNMANATTYMQEAFDNAVFREANLNFKGSFSGHASGFADTPAGKIGLHFVVAEGRATIRPQHMRKTWTLNGKRIAASKLEAALI